ncbi:hypothetical protein BH09ACT10_BH09ACT10_26940 [soil metagenome]
MKVAPDVDSPDGPFLLFLSQGLTGVLGPSAKAVTRGAQAAVDYLNDLGGLHGRSIAIEIEDNKSDPASGAEIVRAALQRSPKPDLVIPGASSIEALAAAPVLGEHQVIGLSPASSSALDDPDKYPFFFGQSALQKHILAAVASFMRTHGTTARVAVVTPSDGLGDAINQQLEGAFGPFGITTTQHRYDPSSSDYSSTFEQAKATNPDWIYMEGAGNQAATVLVSRVAAGCGDIPSITGTAAGSVPLLDFAKGTNQMDNVWVIMLPTVAYVAPEDRDEQFAAFVAGVEKQGPLEAPLATYAGGWDSVILWADAVKNVDGELTSSAVRHSLINLPPASRLFYRTTYSAASNFVTAQPDEITVAQVESVRDGMYVFKDSA